MVKKSELFKYIVGAMFAFICFANFIVLTRQAKGATKAGQTSSAQKAADGTSLGYDRFMATEDIDWSGTSATTSLRDAISTNSQSYKRLARKGVIEPVKPKQEEPKEPIEVKVEEVNEVKQEEPKEPIEVKVEEVNEVEAKPEEVKAKPEPEIRLNAENMELLPEMPYEKYIDSLNYTTDNARRRIIVRGAIHHAFAAYKTYCWGQDDLKPVSQTCDNWLGGNGNTLIDSLSTLYVAGLHRDFAAARDWVRDSLDFDNTKSAVSHFETVIRLLGGLISSYDLSGDPVFLTKAVDLGERLAHVFSGKSGLPKGKVNYGKKREAFRGNRVSVAELGTIQMEYMALSERSGRPEFGQRAQKVTDWLESKSKGELEVSNLLMTFPPGLLPTLVNTDKGNFINKDVSFGGEGDSFYEYLVKVWVLTGKKLDQYKRMYETAIESMHEHIIRKNGARIFTDKLPRQYKMEHLECFVGGMLALGVSSGCDTADPELSKKVGLGLAETCYQGYAQTKTGIGGDVMSFKNGKVFANRVDYFGRPETSESIYYMWKTTKDPVWRDKAWKIFTALEKHTRVRSGGYTDLKNVSVIPALLGDHQNSFFISETLKYLYLVFCDDDVLPLKGIDEDKYERMYVLNTEAQPILAWGYD